MDSSRVRGILQKIGGVWMVQELQKIYLNYGSGIFDSIENHEIIPSHDHDEREEGIHLVAARL